MSIAPIESLFPGMQGVTPAEARPRPAVGGTTPQQGELSFGDFLVDAVKEVNGLQIDAENKIEAMVLKKDDISPHTAMIALEKADVAFQLMNAVKSRIIRAYEEVMRTQL